MTKDPDVEVVYIGSINTTHLPIGKLALEGGKHVLCEKPMTINLKETKELQELAKAKKLFLMEALWSRFMPAYRFVMEQISSGVIGDVYNVSASFGATIENNARVATKELGGSAILDIGSYIVNLIDMVFQEEKPLKIKAAGHLNKNGNCLILKVIASFLRSHLYLKF